MAREPSNARSVFEGSLELGGDEPEPGCDSPPGPDGPPVGGYCNGVECGTSHIVAWQYAEVCPPNICCDAVTGTYTVGLSILMS